MSSQFKQTLMMIKVNILSLPRRFALALSMAFSVALVVCVLAGFLSMAAGFERALTSAGSANIAVILGGGTNQESSSDIPANAIRAIDAMRTDIGVKRNAAGNIISSREIVVPVEIEDERRGITKMLALRGMERAGPSLRDGVALSAGRFAEAGAREIVIGEQIATEFPGMVMGKQVRLGSVNWTVVGQFSSDGSAFDSEIWGDLDAVRSSFDRLGDVQSIRLRLNGNGTIDTLKTAVQDISTSPLNVVREADLYAAQSSGTAHLIRLFGWPLALLMALGATAGALNTMMSSVSDRTVEIATVRALGFSRLSTFIATWCEAVILAIIGVTMGLIASWLVFNGWQASTIGTNNASMSFQLSVNGGVMLTAGLLGLAIGIIGGALPAYSATRQPITAALRARG